MTPTQIRRLVAAGHTSITRIAVEAGWVVATIDLRAALAAGVVRYNQAGFLEPVDR